MEQEVKLTLEITLSVDADIQSEYLKHVLLQTVGAYSCNASKVSIVSEKILDIKEESEIYKTHD